MTTKVTVEHKLVGPAHDPYSRAIYTAQVGHQHVRLVCCALAGTSLEVNGVLQSNSSYGTGCREPDMQRPIEEFERLVGRTLDSIEQEYDESWSEDPMGHPSQYI